MFFAGRALLLFQRWRKALKFDPSDRSAVENYLFLLGAIVPRPIALVSTVSLTGVFNVAPFSFFNGVCAVPPILSVSIAPRDGKKKRHPDQY